MSHAPYSHKWVDLCMYQQGQFCEYCHVTRAAFERDRPAFPCSGSPVNAVRDQAPRAELEVQLEEATELLARLSDRFACAACHSSSHVAVKGNACACGYSDVIAFLRKASSPEA